MSYTIDLQVEENILFGKWDSEFNFKEEIRIYNDQVRSLLDTLSEPIYFIMVFDGVKLSVEDIISGANIATREERPTFLHKNIEQIIFVTTNRKLQMAAKGLNTVTFGNLNIHVVETLDTAVNYVQSKQQEAAI